MRIKIYYTRKIDYLVGDNLAAYNRRDDGGNSGDAIGDGYHSTGKVWTEIDMIDLETA